MGKKKRTIFWIIPLLILFIFIYLFGPKKAVTDNQYISYIKAAPLTVNSIETTETAFKNYCEKSNWEYFQTKMLDHVVEFKGKCKVNNEVQSVNLQYIVENNQLDKATNMLEQLTKNPIITFNKKERSRYLFTYGSFFLKQKNYNHALTYLKKAEEIGFQNNDTILLKRIYKGYAHIYSHLQDYKQAFIHMQNYVHLLERTVKSNFTSKTHELDIKQHAFANERKANIDSLSGLNDNPYINVSSTKLNYHKVN